jgi:uncharacterized protein involved in cysteine biosynthesis
MIVMNLTDVEGMVRGCFNVLLSGIVEKKYTNLNRYQNQDSNPWFSDYISGELGMTTAQRSAISGREICLYIKTLPVYQQKVNFIFIIMTLIWMPDIQSSGPVI